ncbi:uncharacterized protein LOC119610297 [Lucilia sericata]|uniref:uncharacterized protein LOC119610297 n=1 Tax=Lucilia sericata TaxID=13632 RepID=UPI0018A7FAD8|nr:uncharacterized protein LOC119610297 [Lucilia sericata]
MEYVSCSYRNGFITLRQFKTNEWLEEVEMTTETSAKLKKKFTKPPLVTYENPYKLRFQPGKPMPRLFWQRYPQQQQEESATTTESGMEITTTVMPIVTEMPEPEVTEEPTEPPPETEPPETTTSKPKTSTTSPRPTKLPTTSTTIMKPSSPFPFNVAEKLKNLFVFGSPSQVNLIQKHGSIDTKGKTKSKGFLSLFEVIKFANTRCSVSMGDIRSMDGICYHEFECKSLGGISTEKCGEGLGVCCIFLTGCGDTVAQSVFYFESPNYPQPVREMMICVLIINLRKNVQQLRLDFLMFELNRPTDGNCDDDQFIISGQNINFVVPVLCGINTGQHIYVDVENSPDSKIYLSFFAKVPTGSRSFNIKINLLEDNLAPLGCLQYYTELEGIVKSFNYDIEGTIVDNKEATYFNNLNYVICMERAKDYCSVNYIMEQIGGSADQLDFQIINKDEDENDLVPDGQAGAGIFNCPDDFLGINQVRLCGERFNDGTENEDFTIHAPVRDVAAGPIILPFRSDEEYVGRGFRLAYKQELCL